MKNKIINIALIFILTGMSLRIEEGYPSENSHLRVPITEQNYEEILKTIKSLEKDADSSKPDQTPSLVQATDTISFSERVNELTASIEDKCSKFVQDETYLDLKGYTRMPLTTAIWWLLMDKNRFSLRHNISSISEAAVREDKDEIVRQVFYLSKSLEDILRLSDEDLLLKLLRNPEVKRDIRYMPTREKMPEVKNSREVIAKARELFRVFTYEVIKDDIYALIKLCGRDPSEVLRGLYDKNQPEQDINKGKKRPNVTTARFQRSLKNKAFVQKNKELLKMLPEKQRMVLEYLFIEGKTVKETMKAIGITESVLFYHRRVAFAALKRLLDPDSDYQIVINHVTLLTLLPKKQREVLTHLFIDGKAPKEIAKAMTITKQGVSDLKKRAIVRLKKLIGQQSEKQLIEVNLANRQGI